MNQQQQAPTTASSSLAMILTLGSVAMISGLLVVLTWQFTLEPIAENQRIMIEKAIFQVIPGAQQRRTYYVHKGRLTDTDKNSIEFYAAYDQQGQLRGIAASAAAQGYADMVRLLYGYDPHCQCIRGFSIIKMAETPGLGDKILSDPQFLANFKALDARANAKNSRLLHEIVTVKHGTKQNPWEIDAISGATITSKAVGKAINQSAQQLIPQINQVLEQIQTLPGSNTGQTE